MKVLVTGANGMLGSALVPALAAAGHSVVPTDLRISDDQPWGLSGPSLGLLDVRSRVEVGNWLEQVKPEFVVHLAAETDLETCEADPDGAYLTNALGTKHVALACAERDLPLAYVSTGGVFDGEKLEPYHEYDEPAPINVYGRSKLAGEQYVQWFHQRSYIVRAGWMVGGGAKDHKFVSMIADQVRNGATRIFAVNDKFGTPTYAPDFSRCFAELITSRSYGLYHMVCEGRATRLEVAAEILDALGRTDIELVGVDSSHFQERFWAPRSRSEIMRNLLLDLQGWNGMRPWQQALREYLAQAFADLGVSVVGARS